MVSILKEIDYLNATKKDYINIAKKFYDNAAKKYNLHLLVNFDKSFYGSTVSSFIYDIKGRPIHIHEISISINEIFLNTSNRKERFFEFIDCLYHELYHVLITEISDKKSCFNLMSLFSVIQYTNLIDQGFWKRNYYKINEELKAYSYGIKRAYQVLSKYYPDYKNYIDPEHRRIKYLTMLKFYNNYTYNNEVLTKNETLYKMINSFIYNPEYPYPDIIKKVYNFKENHPKTIDELISDFEYYCQLYRENPDKIKEIKQFYTTLISEKYFFKESFDIKNQQKVKCFLKQRLVNEKQRLEFLKKAHQPIFLKLSF